MGAADPRSSRAAAAQVHRTPTRSADPTSKAAPNPSPTPAPLPAPTPTPTPTPDPHPSPALSLSESDEDSSSSSSESDSDSGSRQVRIKSKSSAPAVSSQSSGHATTDDKLQSESPHAISNNGNDQSSSSSSSGSSTVSNNSSRDTCSGANTIRDNAAGSNDPACSENSALPNQAINAALSMADVSSALQAKLGYSLRVQPSGTLVPQTSSQLAIADMKQCMLTFVTCSTMLQPSFTVNMRTCKY